MKLTRNHLTLAVASLLGVFTLTETLNAAPFLYANRDMMLCFRKTGQTGGTVGSFDFEVNLGQASIFYSATPGSSIPVGQFTTTQINGIFDNLDDMSWSVGGYGQPGVGDPNLDDALWLTAPRTDPAVQSTPWQRQSSDSQQGPGQKINSIGSNARIYSGTIASNLNNTVTAVRIPAGNGRDYGTFIGASGNYSDTFAGDVENTTPPDFDSAGLPSRSDLYELRPSSTNGPGTYLGYFELSPAGAVTFFAASSGSVPPPPRPTVTSITRVGTLNTISFTTTNGATYNLRFTNSPGLSAPISTWPVVLNVATGNGSVKSTTDTTTDANRFYSIEAHN